MTIEFTARNALSTGSEIIILLEEEWSGQAPVSLERNSISIRASDISGPGITAPASPSAAMRPVAAYVNRVGFANDGLEIRLEVPDMSDIEGNQRIDAGAAVTVVFSQNAGIRNPTEAGRYDVTVAGELLPDQVLIPCHPGSQPRQRDPAAKP